MENRHSLGLVVYAAHENVRAPYLKVLKRKEKW